MSPPLVVLIAPTASGKSRLAALAAAQAGASVVNMDALQHYAGMAVGTAQPDSEETRLAPHLGYGWLDPAQPFSVGQYLERFVPIVQAELAKGRGVVLVGGTGLYLNALLFGIADIPAIPETVRRQVLDDLEREGSEATHRRLAQLDPETARRLHPADRQRVGRALEVALATGTPLSQWQQATHPPDLQLTVATLEIDRETLGRRSDRRLEAMWKGGLLEEARTLLARALDPNLPAMKGLGYPHALAFLRGELQEEEALAAAQLGTRQYIKRQETWIRGLIRKGVAFERLEGERGVAQLAGLLGG
ncbi:MAG: tRNA (adenosine(37)-N6)-dimethylallyltransferase MiaA [Alphaproteobacteria bacterium CG_4_10_14_0_2_um_filter_63_37]|nr:MAG: tRNA (adenosine(37)-N6)-dimethylallyltransferase MiaA [Proteobacteria bacterium CG1_02_64_396]PJA24754.1 MAG: tRNA (adenosine(37)-N6)-dimethylallyltransferase MiaA [Alphaproteobacteria bacterium CG_4_10_14_0_2_um_filter_63_37]